MFSFYITVFWLRFVSFNNIFIDAASTVSIHKLILGLSFIAVSHVFNFAYIDLYLQCWGVPTFHFKNYLKKKLILRIKYLNVLDAISLIEF